MRSDITHLIALQARFGCPRGDKPGTCVQWGAEIYEKGADREPPSDCDPPFPRLHYACLDPSCCPCHTPGLQIGRVQGRAQLGRDHVSWEAVYASWHVITLLGVSGLGQSAV